MRKLSWHVQAFEPVKTWLPGIIAELAVRGQAPEFLKIIDPPATDPFGGAVKVIGRTFVPDEQSEAMIRMGAAGGEKWYWDNLPRYTKAPYVHAWEFANEPVVPRENEGRTPYLFSLMEATMAWVNLMRRSGRRTVVGNFGVGHPDVSVARRLGPALQIGTYLGLHEYGKRDMRIVNEKGEDDWYTLRYRRTVAELRKAGYGVPPVLIGECGLDNLLWGGGVGGWQMLLNGDQAEYVRQLAWYESELQKDEEVRAAFIFTSGPVAPWQTYDVHEELSRKLMMLPSPEPPPPPPPPPSRPQIHDVTTSLEHHPTKRYDERPLSDICYAVIHHSASAPTATPAGIARFHVLTRDYPGIGYHYGVARDGTVFQVNRLETVSYHAGKAEANRHGVGVCLIGDFSQSGPPVEQTNAAIGLCQWLGLRVCAHKEIVPTGCPGDLRRKWWKRIVMECGHV